MGVLSLGRELQEKLPGLVVEAVHSRIDHIIEETSGFLRLKLNDYLDNLHDELRHRGLKDLPELLRSIPYGFDHKLDFFYGCLFCDLDLQQWIDDACVDLSPHVERLMPKEPEEVKAAVLEILHDRIDHDTMRETLSEHASWAVEHLPEYTQVRVRNDLEVHVAELLSEMHQHTDVEAFYKELAQVFASLPEWLVSAMKQADMSEGLLGELQQLIEHALGAPDFVREVDIKVGQAMRALGA